MNMLFTKDKGVLFSPCYETSKTNLLMFHFEPHPYESAKERIGQCSFAHIIIEGKDIYVFDNLFLDEEAADLRDYSKSAPFEKKIFATHETENRGEKPARALDNQAKWRFFSHPPLAIHKLYQLLGWLAHRLNADICTLPWELCEEKICASAVATNFLEEVSKETMALGKHRDYHPEMGLPFGIPMLYTPEKGFYEKQFTNGAIGKPWLISLILYSTHEQFDPKKGMGTAFYRENGELALSTECRHMRLVFFEGDIVHSIENSHFPNKWRVSYVFKLIINPKDGYKSLKTVFRDLMNTL